MIFMAFMIGISQGTQPIVGFNYGAKKYHRVKKAYGLAVCSASALACIAFLCFQIFPRQIIGVFGGGSEEYFAFAERYFRIFLFMTVLNGIQPVSANFFTSIGKAIGDFYVIDKTDSVPAAADCNFSDFYGN